MSHGSILHMQGNAGGRVTLTILQLLLFLWHVAIQNLHIVLRLDKVQDLVLILRS